MRQGFGYHSGVAASQVSAVDLGFSWRVPVLREFSLELPAGRILLLVGLNGAGKSTALNLLAGALRPKEGIVRILGGDPRRAPVRRHLFHLREEAAVARQLTGTEAVRFHIDLWGRAPRTRSAILELLERFHLLEVAGRRAGTYSKGMQRRLELACLAATDPEVWLLDEPQAGLDPLGLRLLRQICVEARGRGRSLVIASHALSDIPALADEVIALRQGGIFFRGDRAALLGRAGARAYVVSGGDPGTEGALRDAALRHDARIEGPEIPADAIEKLLFAEPAA